MTSAPDGFIVQSRELGIEFEPGDVDRLDRYLTLLLAANTRFNLTAITDPAQAWTRHILDSLTLFPVLASHEPKHVMDVGSGGGLPGIPLAIVMPEVRFALLEATGKKAAFLREVATTLGLANVEVINERAEIVGLDRELHREHYDVVMARAVGRLAVLLELTVPLARIGGIILAMKGEQVQSEIVEAKAALHLLHSHVVQTIPAATGTIVVIEKQRKTARLYPRRPGEPKRVPLGVKPGMAPDASAD